MDDDTASDTDDTDDMDSGAGETSATEGGSLDEADTAPEEPRVVRRARSTARSSRRGGSRRPGAGIAPRTGTGAPGADDTSADRAPGPAEPETDADEHLDTDEPVATDEPDDTATDEPLDTDEPDATDEPTHTEPDDTDTAASDDDGAHDDGAHDVMPPADRPDHLDDPVTPAEPGDSTRSKLVLVSVAVIVLGLLTWVAFFRDDEVAAPPPSSTTSTTTTTAPEAGWPAQTTQVATAKAGLPTVTVLSAPPPEWETSTEVLRWEAPALSASQATMPARPALPRPDYDIKGRYTTESGWEFSNPTSFGEPLTFVVTEARGDWVKVLLPVRPNHTEGYVAADQVDLTQHDYRLELRLSEHRLTAYRGSELIADTPVVTGKDATRTPTGRFFVTDKVEQDDPDGFYGPYVLALNGYSEQLDIFDDGVPVIAIHGTSRPDLLGSSASNGCVRIPNEIITQLHQELPLGTPVEIYA